MRTDVSTEGLEIVTERLRLRPPTEEDLIQLYPLYSDPDVMRYILGGRDRSLEDSRCRLEELIAHHQSHGFSLWVVHERASGALIGDCGLIHFERKGPEIELGYRFLEPYWGRGYATEAASAWVRYGFDNLGLKRIIAVTHPDNRASQNVLEKVGMSYVSEAVAYGAPARLYAIDTIN